MCERAAVVLLVAMSGSEKTDSIIGLAKKRFVNLITVTRTEGPEDGVRLHVANCQRLEVDSGEPSRTPLPASTQSLHAQ